MDVQLWNQADSRSEFGFNEQLVHMLGELHLRPVHDLTCLDS